MFVPMDITKYFCPRKLLAEPFTWIHEFQVSLCILFAISYQLNTAGVTTNHLRITKLVFTARLISISFFFMKNKIWFWNPGVCVFVGWASQCDGKSRNLATHSPYLVLPSLLFATCIWNLYQAYTVWYTVMLLERRNFCAAKIITQILQPKNLISVMWHCHKHGKNSSFSIVFPDLGLGLSKPSFSVWLMFHKYQHFDMSSFTWPKV